MDFFSEFPVIYLKNKPVLYLRRDEYYLIDQKPSESGPFSGTNLAQCAFLLESGVAERCRKNRFHNDKTC